MIAKLLVVVGAWVLLFPLKKVLKQKTKRTI